MRYESMGDQAPEVTNDMVRKLAKLYGLTVLNQDLPEVTRRFRAMLNAAASIEALDLEGIDSAPVIAERELER
jgi:Asp-tRNA(Asn)/Glu-tRNA(Gln) amidotransferase C subunit